MLRTYRSFALLTLGCLALAGCVSVAAPDPGPVGPTVTTGGQIVTQVQSLTRRCQFVPAAASIVGLLTAGTYATALDLAEAICAAVGSPQAAYAGGRRSSSPYILNGVPIRGRWVT
jgi:hypothetical protein